MGGFVPPVKKGKQEGGINEVLSVRRAKDKEPAQATQRAGILREIPRRSFLKAGSSEVLSVRRAKDKKPA